MKNNKMTKLSERAQYYLDSSLSDFKKMSEQEKEMGIKHIKLMLKEDENHVKRIGSGYSLDMVEAGKEFIKIVEKKFNQLEK